MHTMLDLFAVSQRIPTYYSVFVACLKLICNVLSVYQRTCLISHTSAYVGAIRRSVTGPLQINQKMTANNPSLDLVITCVSMHYKIK